MESWLALKGASKQSNVLASSRWAEGDTFPTQKTRWSYLTLRTTRGLINLEKASSIASLTNNCNKKFVVRCSFLKI